MKITGTELIDSAYKDYSKYVLTNRAIPSAIDGLKPVQRKLLYKAIKDARTRKVKVADMGSISQYGYHHGEGSAQDACVNLACDWGNNVPLFKAHGNFGTRLVQEAAAARYIFIELGNAYEQYFSDHNVCPPSPDEEHPEPQHYLPNIPWLLVNGAEGIAVGFATKVLPRDPEDVKLACKEYLSGKPITKMKPSFPGFRGMIEEVPGEQRWLTRGIVKHSKRNLYIIEELPWGYNRTAYFEVLVKLEEDGLIDSFEDRCDDSGFCFEVKIPLAKKEKYEKDPHAYLKLVKSHSENITTIGYDGSLKIFQTAEQLVEYFCDYRLTKVQEQISYDIDRLEEERKFLCYKLAFVKDVNDGVLEPKRMSTKEFTEVVVMKYTFGNAEYAQKLIALPMSSMTEENRAKMCADIEKKTKETEAMKRSVPKKVFMERMK